MSGNSSRKPSDTQGTAADIVVQDRSGAQPSPVDLAEFEKFFREQFAPPASEGTAAVAVAKPGVDDPLMAELARIVGQDVRPAGSAPPKLPEAHDPFAVVAAASVRPSEDPLKAFEEELRRFDAEREAARLAAAAPSVEPDLRGAVGGAIEVPMAMVDADPRRADLEQALQGPAPVQQNGDLRTDLPGDSLAVAPQMLEDMTEGAQPRSRKVMLMLSAAGVIALLGVAGTLGFGSRPKPTGVDAPVIIAKTGPTKEKPADPGGVEISGQDRQVLARRAEDPKTPANVVNKAEQPVDLNQTPKREAARVILPPTNGQQGIPAAPILMPSGSQPPAVAAPPATVTTQPPAQSGEQAASVASLEPKRVRSVRVSGEGEISPPVAQPNVPRPPTLANAPAPQAKNEARPTTAVRTVSTSPATTTPQPARPVPAQPKTSAQDDNNGPLSLRPPAGGRQAAPTRTAATSTATSGSGGFAVQLKASPNEADARSAAASLKQRHSEALGSYTPGVRQGTVSGRTVYRVRVSGLSRDAANGLCSKIKADGGSCFVASN